MTNSVVPSAEGVTLSQKAPLAREDDGSTPSTVVPHIKVLFISGYPADALSHNGTLMDGCDYLSKPFRADDLFAKLDELVRG